MSGHACFLAGQSDPDMPISDQGIPITWYLGRIDCQYWPKNTGIESPCVETNSKLQYRIGRAKRWIGTSLKCVLSLRPVRPHSLYTPHNRKAHTLALVFYLASVEWREMAQVTFGIQVLFNMQWHNHTCTPRILLSMCTLMSMHSRSIFRI